MKTYLSFRRVNGRSGPVRKVGLLVDVVAEELKRRAVTPGLPLAHIASLFAAWKERAAKHEDAAAKRASLSAARHYADRVPRLAPLTVLATAAPNSPNIRPAALKFAVGVTV